MVNHVQSRHLSYDVLLEGGHSFRIIRSILTLCVILILGSIVWASTTEIPEKSGAEGTIEPEGNVRHLKHYDGGTVKRILVQHGDQVKKGQELLEMDQIDSKSALQELKSRKNISKLELIRLNSFLYGTPLSFLSIDPKYSHEIREQLKIYNLQVKSLESKLDTIKTKIEVSNRNVVGLDRNVKNIKKQLVLHENQLKVYSTLLKTGAISKLDYLSKSREKSQTEANYLEKKAELEKAKADLKSIETTYQTVKTESTNQTAQQISTISDELAEINKKITKAEGKNERMIIRAPVDGYITNITPKGTDSVIQPGGHLFDIVPSSVRLTSIVRVKPRDIGHIEIGQPVDINVSAYNVSQYGVIKGTVTYISATSTLDEKKQPYYKVRVSLGVEKFKPNGAIDMENSTYTPYVMNKRNRIIPGMTVTVGIITGHKTLFKYILKSIYSSMDHSFQKKLSEEKK